MKTAIKYFLVLVIALLAMVSTSHATPATGPTELPIDPSYLYTSVSTPTLAAIGVAIGFAAFFTVWGYIMRFIRKR